MESGGEGGYGRGGAGFLRRAFGPGKKTGRSVRAYLYKIDQAFTVMRRCFPVPASTAMRTVSPRRPSPSNS